MAFGEVLPLPEIMRLAPSPHKRTSHLPFLPKFSRLVVFQEKRDGRERPLLHRKCAGGLEGRRAPKIQGESPRLPSQAGLRQYPPRAAAEGGRARSERPSGQLLRRGLRRGGGRRGVDGQQLQAPSSEASQGPLEKGPKNEV